MCTHRTCVLQVPGWLGSLCDRKSLVPSETWQTPLGSLSPSSHIQFPLWEPLQTQYTDHFRKGSINSNLRGQNWFSIWPKYLMISEGLWYHGKICNTCSRENQKYTIKIKTHANYDNKNTDLYHILPCETADPCDL